MADRDEDVRDSLFGPIGRAPRTANGRVTTNDPGSITQSGEVRQKSRTVFDEDNTINPADVQHDQAWSVKLVRMVSRLEYGRSSLEAAGAEGDPAGAVRMASAMLQPVADFIATNVDPNIYAVAISEALSYSARFMAAAQIAGSVSAKRSFFGVFGGSNRNPDRLDECMWVLRDLPLVLERYFGLLGGGFRNQKLALDWVETSGLFISELKRALQWVDGFKSR